jgi:hypothetical protein
VRFDCYLHGFGTICETVLHHAGGHTCILTAIGMVLAPNEIIQTELCLQVLLGFKSFTSDQSWCKNVTEDVLTAMGMVLARFSHSNIENSFELGVMSDWGPT